MYFIIVFIIATLTPFSSSFSFLLRNGPKLAEDTFKLYSAGKSLQANRRGASQYQAGPEGKPTRVSAERSNEPTRQRPPVLQASNQQTQQILTGPDVSRVKIGGQRWIFPGDYVVHEEFGVGKYLGIRMVDITPARNTRNLEPVVVIQYADGEVAWFQRIVEKELWLFRSSDAGDQELSNLVDRRKWKRRRKLVEEQSHSLALSLSKMMAIRNGFHRTPCAPDDAKYHDFEDRFAYPPTEDQLSCFATVAADMMNNTRPMDRLVCGDVGFGKTEVAMRAIYRAVLSKKQVALLAPTRVLAMQHLRVLSSRMPDVNIRLLRGGGKGDAAKVKEQIKSGECQVVVGTHALLQPTVTFGNLGLLVIDEEQRFGVAHKEKLKAASSGTDVLTLSATPIPRTLQMSLSGLRDLSIMNSPPEGRKEVRVDVERYDEDIIRQAISKELERGGQVFVVVPFVQNVDQTRYRLEEIIPGLRVIEAHGQHDDLEDRIDNFSAGKADVLVATTVIENGIDMPNVNTIIVLYADRFGISALYQLRGRVGRSQRQAFAYFMTNTTSITVEAENRLNYLKTFTALGSGYDLARRDMEMRGFGTIFGSQQSGVADVGLDLQASILESAISRLNEDHVLSVPDTRVSLQCDLEMLGVKECGMLPPSDDLTAISRWEASLAETILSKHIPYDKAAAAADKKLFKKNAALRAYFAAGTISALEDLREDWDIKLGGLPKYLYMLLQRSECRVACRRLGVTEVIRSDSGGSSGSGSGSGSGSSGFGSDSRNSSGCKNDNRSSSGRNVHLLTASIDKKKWEKLEGCIPAHLRGRVTFEPVKQKHTTVNLIEGPDSILIETTSKLRITGKIMIHNAYPSFSRSGEGEGDDTASGDEDAFSEVLQVVRPMAAYVDELLNAEVAECNPEKGGSGGSDNNENEGGVTGGETETAAAKVLSKSKTSAAAAAAGPETRKKRKK